MPWKGDGGRDGSRDIERGNKGRKERRHMREGVKVKEDNKSKRVNEDKERDK